MKKNLTIIGLLSFLSLLTFDSLEARGGGGGRGGGGFGGGGGRGGDFGGGRSMQRSPSMSRASRPDFNSAPRMDNRAGDFGRDNRVNDFGRNNGSLNQISRDAPSRNQLQSFLKNQPDNNLGQRNLANDRYQNLGNTVRNNVGDRYPGRNNWFGDNFWDQHNYHPGYYNRDANWWAAATAVGVGSWLGWDDQPYYYDYDDSGDGTWDSGSTYANTEQQSQQPDYTQQSQSIDTVSAVDTNSDWMPLGVFALTKSSDSTVPPNMYMQLAVSKQGAIAGTLYIASTDQTYPLEGWVDPKTQKAAWKMSNNSDSAIVETGIYNLTEAEAPIRLYFNNNSTQNMLLVRVNN